MNEAFLVTACIFFSFCCSMKFTYIKKKKRALGTKKYLFKRISESMLQFTFICLMKYFIFSFIKLNIEKRAL